jgi:hypothetical protein
MEVENVEYCKLVMLVDTKDYSVATFIEKIDGVWYLIKLISNEKGTKKEKVQIDEEKAKKILELVKSEV